MKQEHLLSCQIAKYLRMQGYITLDTDVMSALRYLPAADRRRVLYINAHTAAGYTKGQADLVVLSPHGRTIYIELKNGTTGRQSAAQKSFQAEIERRGGEYVIIRDIADIISFVSKDKNGNSGVPPCTQSLAVSAFN